MRRKNRMKWFAPEKWLQIKITSHTAEDKTGFFQFLPQALKERDGGEKEKRKSV